MSGARSAPSPQEARDREHVEPRASGGYYIACGADVIVADPATITGSIGVFGGKLNVLGLLPQARAHDRNRLTRPQREHAVPVRGLRPRRRRSSVSRWTRSTARSSRVFPKGAACPRLRWTRSRRVASGPGWPLADSGLVDTLGGLSTAVAIARRHAKVAEGTSVRLEPFPSPKRAFWHQVFGSFFEDDETARARLARPPYPNCSPRGCARPPSRTGTVLAIMPFTLEMH